MLSSDYTATCHKQMLPIRCLSPDLAGLSVTHLSSKVSSRSLICIFLTLFSPAPSPVLLIFIRLKQDEQRVEFMMVAPLTTYTVTE